MPYTDHFKLTDDLIQHLDPLLSGLGDPFVESRYTGFLAVSSVTVLELAMKTLFIDFASKKHKMFGGFCFKSFERLNGRIGLDQIKAEYLPKFGDKYETRFACALERMEKQELKVSKSSIKASYKNLLTWRNGFVHQGNIPTQATYAEVKRAYGCGKQVMNCLGSCMRR